MDFKHYIDFTTEDFALDPYFSRWIFHPDDELERFWKEFMDSHPEKRDQIMEAKTILKCFIPLEPSITREQLDRMSPDKIRQSTKRRAMFVLIKAAAVLLFVVSLGGLAYYFMGGDQGVNLEIPYDASEEVGKIILSDGTVKMLDQEQSTIKQTATGEILVNDEAISVEKKKAGRKNQGVTQVIVPYGKRMQIELADGTRIWLNSGSMLLYPENMEGHTREVQLTGEAFFDVKTDPQRPFNVITTDMSVKVFGTRFNVKSYKDDHETQTVLVAGSVSVQTNERFSKGIDMLPGERIVFDRTDERFTKESVDVNLYTSWVEGYLVFDQKPILEIFRELERYYDVKIVTERELRQLTFSGKLDLAENITEVLERISFSASIKYEMIDNGLYNIK